MLAKYTPELKYAIDRVLDIFSGLGEETVNRIKDEIYSFEDEEELIQYLINGIPVYVEPGQEPSDEVLSKIVKKEGIILDEKVHLTHVKRNAEGKGILSHKVMTILPLYVRANQQIAMKEGKVASESLTRSITGQVSGKSARSGALTDAELSVTIAQNADAIMQELLGPASHDLVAKREMKQAIIKTGDAKLEDLTEDSKNKRSLLYMSHILRSIDIDTDMIEEPIKW